MLVKVGSGRLCRRWERGGDRWLVTHNNNNIFFVSLLLNGKYSTLTHCECYLIFLFFSDFFSVYLFFLVLIIIIIIMIISSSRIRIRIIIDIIYTELFPKAQGTTTWRGLPPPISGHLPKTLKMFSFKALYWNFSQTTTSRKWLQPLFQLTVLEFSIVYNLR